VLALTIKTKKEESVPEPVTLASLLLPFKEVKGLNTKMLYNLFLFKGKVLKAKGKDLEFNKSMSLKDIYIISSLQKHRARKVFKRFFRKKLKIKPIKPLVFNKINRKKGKAVIIAKVNRKEIIKKLWLKQKIKCLYYLKTLVKLIETLDFKKEPEGGVLSILQWFIIA